MPRRGQGPKRIPREDLDRATTKAREAMAAFIKDPDFFPAPIVEKNRLLAEALNPSSDYLPDKDIKEYLPRTLREAEGIINWCAYGMRISMHNPLDFLASSYRKVINNTDKKPASYLAMKGYGVFMEELGLDPESIKTRRTRSPAGRS
jgi:hypothetical protein